MEITLKIDITERLQAIAERFAGIATEYVGKMGECKPVTERISCGAMSVKTCEIPLESAPQDAREPEAVGSTASEQNDAPAQLSCDCETVSDAQPEKPKAKKSRANKSREDSSAQSAPVEEPQKAAPETPQSVEDPSTGNLPSEPQNDAQTKASCESEPEKAKPADDDPYCGMTLLGAVQSLLDEIGQKGIELADVNARVRKECTARSLPFTSAACLMKAVGYKEARRIAIGE